MFTIGECRFKQKRLLVTLELFNVQNTADSTDASSDGKHVVTAVTASYYRQCYGSFTLASKSTATIYRPATFCMLPVWTRL